MPLPSAEDSRDRGRICEYLTRLRRSVAEGDTHSAWAFRTLLLTALENAGSCSLEAETSRMLERAHALFSRIYAALQLPEHVDLRCAIDSWEQDYHGIAETRGSGVTPLRAIYALLSSTPVESLTVERIHELEGLLDGTVAVTPTEATVETTV